MAENGRLEELGWRPIDEAPCPYGPCFVRLGPGDYTIGECDFEVWPDEPDESDRERIWVDKTDRLQIFPTHFMDYAD